VPEVYKPERSLEGEAAAAFMKVIWQNHGKTGEPAPPKIRERTTIDLNSGHMIRTPERLIESLRELTTPKPFNFTKFESDVDEMVVIKNIHFVSLCAHHVVPFMGVCHIAYVPAGQIAGLSKFARLVKNFAANLTVQEELTNDIGEFLKNELDPKGVAVQMEAEHLCMTIRGVQSPGTTTVTSKMLGVFADHARLARQEFLAAIK
jgi:GTP cyclohydrolase I